MYNLTFNDADGLLGPQLQPAGILHPSQPR